MQPGILPIGRPRLADRYKPDEQDVSRVLFGATLNEAMIDPQDQNPVNGCWTKRLTQLDPVLYYARVLSASIFLDPDDQ
jgi:hypothetical protein